MRREDVEKVLEKYHVKLSFDSFKDVMESTKFEDLKDDLLALTSQPSREGLEKIIVKHFGHIKTTIPQTWPFDPAMDDLMAWATGTKTWCKHLKKAEPPAVYQWWYLKGAGCDASDWTCCPICGVKRPESSYK